MSRSTKLGDLATLLAIELTDLHQLPAYLLCVWTAAANIYYRTAASIVYYDDEGIHTLIITMVTKCYNRKILIEFTLVFILLNSL